MIGQPASHGCIRMKNDDIIELFSLVKHRTKVQIA
ncbi:MAG: L,D-transpeptidase [Candidatus Altimarinota bacterium]